MSKARVGVLISGRGSNMVSLIEAGRAADSPYEIVLVLSDNPDAGGLEKARSLGVEARAIDRRPFGKDREAHERALDAALREAGVEYVALAGYMRILTPWLVAAWEGRMVNIHPSLLPKYPGLDTHNRALEAGDIEAGCTVHLVTNDLDCGPILGQTAVPILPGDDEATLSARVLAEEHRLYPRCLAHLVSS
jgi:phosphoribosylglycinamide formyltransferase-1